MQLDDDLRDIVVRGDRLLVSRFRSAELLVLDPEGRELARTQPPTASVTKKVPRVAWRMVPTDDGGVMMSHQLHLVPNDETAVPVTPGGYGAESTTASSGCPPVLASAVTKFDADGQVAWWAPNLLSALPVDVAPQPLGGLAVAAAGFMPSIQFLPKDASEMVPAGSEVPCVGRPVAATGDRGQLVAVAYDQSGKLVTQTRQPPALVFDGVAIALDAPDTRDTGHDLFHRQTRSGVACASCHPEGNEDGHVWRFDSIGLRRTQPLTGGIAKLAPFHWSGDLESFEQLVHEVMTVRMSGFRLTSEQTDALANWIETLPAWKLRQDGDLAAVERGRTLFNDALVGCASCHAGADLTNNETVAVGTGEPLQVPTLRGVSRRAPFMHDGCAPTLLDRFGPCGGGDRHGITSHLATGELRDLTRYLESL